MNREEKLKKATALIQKLVPSIMELKDNCLFLYDGYIMKIARKYEYYNEVNYFCVSVKTDKHDNRAFWFDIFDQKRMDAKNKKILGREIQFQDVLLALDSDKRAYKGMNYEYYKFGWEKIRIRDTENSIEGYYDYGESFDCQAEKFYDFLIKTLEE